MLGTATRKIPKPKNATHEDAVAHRSRGRRTMAAMPERRSPQGFARTGCGSAGTSTDPRRRVQGAHSVPAASRTTVAASGATRPPAA